jgi:hypothetical protein
MGALFYTEFLVAPRMDSSAFQQPMHGVTAAPVEGEEKLRDWVHVAAGESVNSASAARASPASAASVADAFVPSPVFAFHSPVVSLYVHAPDLVVSEGFAFPWLVGSPIYPVVSDISGLALRHP